MQPVPDSGLRLALLVATSVYNDPDLTELRAPGLDADELAAVLRDPRIGGFGVEMRINATSAEVQEGIEDFCADRHPNDQLLIYLSCHGVLDSNGRLYYAAANTRRQRLAATAVAAAWLNERLEDCRARSQLLVLDCCHSGAFARGAKGDAELALQQRFEPRGRGRVVFTTSRDTEYSFEGDHASGEDMRSVFTYAIVNGLRTGDADRDKDGLITVTDLYQYVYDNVRAAESRQRPELWLYGAEGNLLVAHSIRGAVIEPVPLPEYLRITLESPSPRVRETGVAELAELLGAADPGLALTAQQTLQKIAGKDFPRVAERARAALKASPLIAADQLLRMEAELGKRVVGKVRAVQAVSDAVRRSRTGVSDPDRPTGAFLFLGPTGVGKTELAKALAEFLFDDERAIIRIDMSEYSEKHPRAMPIGDPPGDVDYEEGGQLTERVSRRPYCVVLLDEAEKAPPEVFDVLRQVLDDGRLTDGQGRTVDFRNTILVLTSNVGSQFITDPSFGDEMARRGAVISAVRAAFKPEFLNWLDNVIVFDVLSTSDITQIVDLQIERLAGRTLTLTVTPVAREWLAMTGWDPVYGARPLCRLIQVAVGDQLARALLAGEVIDGDEVVVDLDEVRDALIVQRAEPVARLRRQWAVRTNFVILRPVVVSIQWLTARAASTMVRCASMGSRLQW
jgi:AAA domain (Cdc48 subfamily)/C-terminal, D2-small domain, of ClpB protein/Caspase domain